MKVAETFFLDLDLGKFQIKFLNVSNQDNFLTLDCEELSNLFLLNFKISGRYFS
jgi:hypothetical protein